MNLLQLCGKFRGAAVVAGAQDEIQQFLERRGMLRRSPEDRLQQTYSFLRQSITRKKVNIRQRLRNEFLRLIIELAVQGILGGLCSYFRAFSLLYPSPGSRPDQLHRQV